MTHIEILAELESLEEELVAKSIGKSESQEKHFISMADGVRRSIQRIEYVLFNKEEE